MHHYVDSIIANNLPMIDSEGLARLKTWNTQADLFDGHIKRCASHTVMVWKWRQQRAVQDWVRCVLLMHLSRSCNKEQIHCMAARSWSKSTSSLNCNKLWCTCYHEQFWPWWWSWQPSICLQVVNWSLYYTYRLAWQVALVVPLSEWKKWSKHNFSPHPFCCLDHYWPLNNENFTRSLWKQPEKAT